MYTNVGKDNNTKSPSTSTKSSAAAREHPLLGEINSLERI